MLVVRYERVGRMADNKIGGLPVVDQDNHVVGLRKR
jgi:hypothetical protein